MLLETKGELVSIITEHKSQNESPPEMSVEDLSSLFGHVISTLQKDNKEKNELKFASIKEVHFEKFKTQVEHQLQHFDGQGIISLVTRNVVSGPIPNHISTQTDDPKNTENKNEIIYTAQQCPRCRQQHFNSESTLPENEVQFLDTFEELTCVNPCATCKWKVDASLLENASSEFKAKVVSTFKNIIIH